MTTEAKTKYSPLMIAVASPFIAVLIGAMLAWRGYVLSIMWAWFVMPVFAVRPLSVPYAVGLMLVWAVMSLKRAAKDKQEGKWEWLAVPFLAPAFLLAIGWLLTKFL